MTVDFTEQIEASKFEFGASKCETKEDRIKFCKEYLEKHNEQVPGPKFAAVLADNNVNWGNLDWRKDPFDHWEVLSVKVAINDWILTTINEQTNPNMRDAELYNHIHKKAYDQLMDEIVKKGYVTIQRYHSLDTNVTTFEHRMTVRRTK